MAHGRSTKIISMMKWIRNSRLSIQNFLSVMTALVERTVADGSAAGSGMHRPPSPPIGHASDACSWKTISDRADATLQEPAPGGVGAAAEGPGGVREATHYTLNPDYTLHPTPETLNPSYTLHPSP